MKRFLFISYLILFSACVNSNSDLTGKFNNYLKIYHHQDIQNKIYVIIPLNICGSCVDEMINLLNNNVKNYDQIIIILADYTTVTIKKKAKDLSDFKILFDNKMKVTKENIINGDKIVLFKITDKKVKESIVFEPYQNEKQIISFINK